MIDLVFRRIVAFDYAVAAFIQSVRDPTGIRAFSIVTTFGSWWLVLALLVVVVLVFLKRRRFARAAGLAGGFVGTQAVVFSVKYLVARERPELGGLSSLAGSLQTASFPSGHAATAMVFYGFLVWFAVAREENPWLAAACGVCGALFIAAIGFSRIYLGVHYFSDVIAGFIVGAVFLVGAGWFSGKGCSRMTKGSGRGDDHSA